MRSSHRTNSASPLRIAEVSYPESQGLVGITICPGKKQSEGMSGPCCRDLSQDLDAIKEWGADIVVTLIQNFEFAILDVTDLGEGVQNRGMQWWHLPIEDGNVPSPNWEQGWASASPFVHPVLRQGGRVLIHCRGGLGRAGLVASRVLIEAGATAIDAVEAVRSQRPGAIETPPQEAYIERLGSRWLMWRNTRPLIELQDWADSIGRRAARGHPEGDLQLEIMFERRVYVYRLRRYLTEFGFHDLRLPIYGGCLEPPFDDPFALRGAMSGILWSRRHSISVWPIFDMMV